MLTNEQINELIAVPKRIVSRSPVAGYREENRHSRCDLNLESESDGTLKFVVFIRQNLTFIENYSIGLRHDIGDPNLGYIVLARYNGPHGEYGRSPDGHYALPHIHRITARELQSGSIQPQERIREVTDRYGTFVEALQVFVNDTGITNLADYFPELRQGQLYDGN